MKKDNSIPDFRFKTIKKDPTYHPKTPKVPIIQIKAQNMQQELLNDIFSEAKIPNLESQGKIKIMK